MVALRRSTSTGALPTRLGPLALLAVLTATGCVVQESREDILRLAWRCRNDVDCAKGWECRSFAFDPAGQGYCVKPCTADADCDFGDLCSNEGFCVEPCDLTAPTCRDPKFHCQRWNLTPGQQTGICQPANACDSSADCDAGFDQCLPSALLGMTGTSDLETNQSVCMDSCSAGSGCETEFSCLPDVLDALGVPEQNTPRVCVPRCGRDNACPNGFRCLLDALADLEDPQASDEELKYCFPGIAGLELPCASDRDCLTGYCVEDPSQTLENGSPKRVCSLPCGDGGVCDVGFQCRTTEHRGATADFCFRNQETCTQDEDCTAPLKCLDMGQIDEQGKRCLPACNGWRDPTSCGEGTTCVAERGATGQFGCMPGWPGYPCATTDQCDNSFGENAECLSPTGNPADAICTKTCNKHSDCAFQIGAVTLNYACVQGHCQPIGQACSPGQSPVTPADSPLPCGPDTVCAWILGSTVGTGICTIDCADMRADTENDPYCPEQFACSPLNQGTFGDPQIEYYCLSGYPGFTPCSRDSECADVRQDGSASCASITGQPLSTNGTCSIPCHSAADCRLGEESADDLLFCLPGAPGQQPGFCFSNAPLDVITGQTDSFQGVFCSPIAPNCPNGYRCVKPIDGIMLNTTVYGDFCAKECNNDAECPSVPVPHSCSRMTGSGVQKVCHPTPYLNGAPLWSDCIDHRECETAFCYRSSGNDAFGHCTQTCGDLGNECPEGFVCGGSDLKVCRPAGVQQP